MDFTNDQRSDAFYANVFGDAGVRANTGPIHVGDVEETLVRAWDFGGTVLSASDHLPAGGLASATFSDPRGKVISIVADVDFRPARSTRM
jgi:hypothetical protein